MCHLLRTKNQNDFQRLKKNVYMQKSSRINSRSIFWYKSSRIQSLNPEKKPNLLKNANLKKM